jgi:hypothetical protein
VMPTFVPGWVSSFLQVPLPSPLRARSCFVPFLGSLGRLAVHHRSGPPCG